MNTPTWELRPTDPEYPELLRHTPDPPKVIYGCGDAQALEAGLAVIGARKATPYGITCASRFAGWAARHGVCVVSGAAIGCDTAAHEAALAAGGRTVAVLGCGADVDYPQRAAGLLATLRTHHAVISEVPWGSPPQRWAFSERNRIIAGLCRAILVVEAGLPSGTFGTADHALAAGRDVLAVPGSILSPECQGSNRLISQGCTPITCESELQDALFSSGFDLFTDSDTPDHPPMTRETDPVMRALVANPMRPDDLAFHMCTDVVSIARHLTRLEIQGCIVRLRDGRFSVTKRS